MADAIDAFEQGDSPREVRTNDKLTARRHFIVPWADRYTYRGFLVDWPPHLYPYAPDFYAYCRSCSIDPYGKHSSDGGRSAYESAELWAEYGTPEATTPQSDPTNPSEIISEQLEPSVEYLTIDPLNRLRWKTPSKPPGGAATVYEMVSKAGAPGIPIVCAAYTLTRHNLTFIPQAAWDKMRFANALAVQTRLTGSPRITMAPGTLLYLGPQIGRSVFSAGNNAYSLTMKFLYRASGWNKFYRHILATSGTEADNAWDSMQKLGEDGVTWIDWNPFPLSNLQGLL